MDRLPPPITLHLATSGMWCVGCQVLREAQKVGNALIRQAVIDVLLGALGAGDQPSIA